jgi:ADP-dependent NAD(P)H-hydrate dehydratase / NAD(P)H-hydrate epimerase
MRLISKSGAKRLDRKAELEFDIKSETLQEAAGVAFVNHLKAIYKLDSFNINKKNIIVLVGPGNNGCDGFVIAKILKNKNYSSVKSIKILIVEMTSEPSELWLKQKERAIGAGVPISELSGSRGMIETSEANLIIDAVYGIGLNRPLSKNLVDLIRVINKRKQEIVAVDIPTGLDAQTGLSYGAIFKCKHTITFGACKVGMVQGLGPLYCGQTFIDKINFPKDLIRQCTGEVWAFGKLGAQNFWPKRSYDSHKTQFGRVIIFAGDAYPGAAVLVCRAALALGAGYVEVVSSGPWAEYLKQVPEVLLTPFEKFNWKNDFRKTAFVVGPGLSEKSPIKKIIEQLLKLNSANVVLDAEAVNFLAREDKFKDKIKLPSHWILTPHAGELSRLIGVQAKDLKQDRLHYSQVTSQLFGSLVLFKGYRSIISNTKSSVIITSGNNALAKAGTGDVLSGFIGSLLAQGLTPMRALMCASWFHGHIADDWVAEGNSSASLTPSLMIERATHFDTVSK